MVAALGGKLVGISHECDHPEAVRQLPRVTATPVDASAASVAIDAEVRRIRAEGRPVIAVDADALRRLRPDLVITQGLCEVCAVADGEVVRVAQLLDPAPEILSLTGTTLAGVEADLRRIGSALGRAAAADEVVAEMKSRLARLRARPATGRRVLCVEWLEPLYLAGHWVPELVAAGGATDVGARAGDHSTVRRWTEVAALRPDLIMVMLCGFGVERARQELDAVRDNEALELLGSVPVWILDGNAYTSRPGPRLVDGAERIRAALEGRECPGLMHWAPGGRAG
jgi:iron complex transport system substrate-binding protein